MIPWSECDRIGLQVRVQQAAKEPVVALLRFNVEGGLDALDGTLKELGPIGLLPPLFPVFDGLLEQGTREHGMGWRGFGVGCFPGKRRAIVVVLIGMERWRAPDDRQ